MQIEGKAKKRSLPLTFHGKCDHLDEKLREYKVRVQKKSLCSGFKQLWYESYI